MPDKKYFPGNKLHIRCPRYKGQSLSWLRERWHSRPRSRAAMRGSSHDDRPTSLYTPAPKLPQHFFCQGKESCSETNAPLQDETRMAQFQDPLGSGGLPRLSNEDRLPGTEGQKSQARLILNTFSCSIQFIILFFS